MVTMNYIIALEMENIFLQTSQRLPGGLGEVNHILISKNLNTF